MKKILPLTILICSVISLHTSLQAATSSQSFKMSVTIPQHVGTHGSPQTSIKTVSNSDQVNALESITYRENQKVLVQTVVAK